MPESDIAGELVAGFADAWNRADTDALPRVFGEDAGGSQLGRGAALPLM
jgi:hypothetical protein